MTARASGPGTPRDGSGRAVWLRLEAKEIGPGQVVLELVATARRQGPGLSLAGLKRLLQVGDRVRIAIALEAATGEPAGGARARAGPGLGASASDGEPPRGGVCAGDAAAEETT